MNELNMSSYIQTMQPGLMTHDKQESAGVFLLSAINDQEFVGLNGYSTDNLSSKKISRIVSRDDLVPDGLRQASMLPNVIDDTVRYFREVVMKDMNPHLLDDIDHFIPKNSSRFTNKMDAGHVENLVLACFDCNRSKSDLELADEDLHKVNPDGPDICKSFYRDDDYYIRISKDFTDDEAVKTFYRQLRLGSQTHRLDYLLVSMRGLRDKLKDNPAAYIQLNEAIELMQQKRR